MKIYLSKPTSGTRDITKILSYWTWSGDKATISRQLTGEVAYIEGSGLPVPEIGDLLTMADGGKKLFEGIVLQRSLGSEDSTMSFTAFDRSAALAEVCGGEAEPADHDSVDAGQRKGRKGLCHPLYA